MPTANVHHLPSSSELIHFDEDLLQGLVQVELADNQSAVIWDLSCQDCLEVPTLCKLAEEYRARFMRHRQRQRCALLVDRGHEAAAAGLILRAILRAMGETECRLFTRVAEAQEWVAQPIKSTSKRSAA